MEFIREMSRGELIKEGTVELIIDLETSDNGLRQTLQTRLTVCRRTAK